MTYFEAGEWPVSYAGTGCSAYAEDSGDSGELTPADFELMAANLLWNWTNRIFGTRTETIRPSRIRTPFRPSTWEGMGPAAAYYDLGRLPGWGWLPAYANGEWLTLLCGICGQQVCEHNSSRAIHLPGPVSEIVEIKIDGAVLDPAKYRVDYGHTLIRQDGNDWPSEQDLIAPADSDPTTSANTWEITFTHGVPVPLGGQLAAGMLACELYKAAIEDDSCRLPSRVSSVTRQGVSMEIVQTEFARSNTTKEVWTAIFAIDSWVSSVIIPHTYVGVASPDYGVRSTPKRPYDGIYGR